MLGMISLCSTCPILGYISAEEFQTESDENYRILFVTDYNWGGNVPSIINHFNTYGWEVTTTAMNKTVNGCSYVNHASMEVDITLENITDLYIFDCVSILPGTSHPNLLNNIEFHRMIQNWVLKGLIVTAWCRAVRILARADVLNGRNITGHDDYQSEYEAAGATFNYKVPPIVDGNIITSVRSNYYQLRTCELIRTTVENNKPKLYDFSTYLGGSGDERGVSANLYFLGDNAVDSEGNIIVVGRSASDDFPVLNPYQETRNGGIDVIISKFYPNGTLNFSTYFGGNGNEWATGVALDSDDNIVFAGTTGSTNFPIKDPYQGVLKGGYEGGYDSYVAKLSKDGQSLLYSTFFGGTGSDWCYEMNVDNNDRIAITGTTQSSNLPLLNAYQSTITGGLEAYVTVFEADGQSLAYSTYIGSFSNDHGRGLDFDVDGNLYVTGVIGDSSHGTNGVFQPNAAGYTEAYLAKFGTSGDLEFFTYLGGSAIDRANDLRIDSSGNILITGYTYSSDFPLRKAAQKEIGGWKDVFISKFDALGQKLIYSTYYGGEDIDGGYAITCDSEGNAIVTGNTRSPDFVTTYASNENVEDETGFLLKFNPKGRCIFSTFLGGSNTDIGVGISWHSNSSYIVTGFTRSIDFPIYHAIQGEYLGQIDMFVVKFDTQSIEISGVLPSSITGINTAGLTAVTVSVSTGIVLFLRKRVKKS